MELKNVHPGEILQKDFIEPMDIDLKKLSECSNINEKNLKNIINRTKDITFNIAHGLSVAFANSSDFWLNAQKTYDYNERNRKENR
jgi:addiction module HigA family antidote